MISLSSASSEDRIIKLLTTCRKYFSAEDISILRQRSQEQNLIEQALEELVRVGQVNKKIGICRRTKRQTILYGID